MAPRTEQCLTCMKNFTKTDMAIQLNCLDSTNNITVQTKLKTCVPEVLICSENDELCTTCNYMLGICYKFRMTCIQSQETLAKTNKRPIPSLDVQQNNPFSIHLKITNQQSTSVPNCEFSFSSDQMSAQQSIVVRSNRSLSAEKKKASSEKVNSPEVVNKTKAKKQEKSIVFDPVKAIEENESLSEVEKQKLVVEEILKLNQHLSDYKAKQFQCEVKLETLPKFYVHKDQVDENTNTGYLCQCNHCGLTFTSKVKLLSHIRRHFNYKPHKCTICDRSYYEADDLKMHMMAHKVDERKKKASSTASSPCSTPTNERESKDSEPQVKKVKVATVKGENAAMPNLIPAINIKTESIYEELNAAPVVTKPPKLVKKASLPNKSKLQDMLNKSQLSGQSNGIATSVLNTSQFSSPQPIAHTSSSPSMVDPLENGQTNTVLSNKTKKFPHNSINMHTVDYLEKYITNLRCRFCSILFQTELETKQHAELHCNICLNLCEYPGAHKDLHTVILNKNKRITYMCLVCRTHHPRGHFIIHHQIFDIICEICSGSFTTDKSYQHHKLACPEYRCKYCDKSFTTLNHGRTHEYHTHEKHSRANLKCPQCNKQFPMAKLLKIHVCRKCETCDEFVDVKHQKRHVCLQPELPLSFLEQRLTTSPFEQLELPEEPEDSKANIPLLIPMEVAENGFKCEVCSNVYETKELLDSHECYDDQGVRVYRCQICTGYFSRLEFIEHMKLHID